MQGTSRERAVLLGLPAMFVVMGLVLFVVGATSWQEARASSSWPSAPGAVTDASVTDRTSLKDGRTTHRYSPQIRYTFEVGGRQYRGSRVGMTSYSSSDPGGAAAVVARYAVGSAVQVHYDPADPARCCLEPGETGGPLLFVAIGAVFATLGGLFTALAWRWLRSGALT